MSNEVKLKNLIAKFICENCEDYLRPPISFCSRGTTICGTCSELSECKDDIIGRCQTLENIGCMLKFPCRYSDFGCAISLTWDEADHHENQCSFKQFICPVCTQDLKCWKGTATALKMHVEIYHKKFIIPDKKYNFSFSDCKGILFIINADELYVLLYECDIFNKLLWLSLKWIGPTEQVKRRHFKLIMCVPNSDEYFERKQAEPAETWEIDKNTALRIDISVLKMKLQIVRNKNIEVKLEIFSRIPLYNGCAGEDLIKDVECIVCQDFMTTSIFQCIVGHSFCGVCKPKLKECPICREVISDSRNFALESICSKINFNCFYMDDGCPFTSTLTNVISHEKECSVGFVDCPLKSFIPLCNWRGKLDQVKNHTLSVHGIKFKR